MAIPFCLPSDEETEDHYRRLEQLLADIYEVLRIILTRQHPHLAVQANFHEMISGTTESQGSQSQSTLSFDEEESLARIPAGIEEVHQRLSHLPDLVLSTLPSNRRPTIPAISRHTPPQVPPRKYKKKSKACDAVDGLLKEKAILPSAKTMSLPDPSWIQVGKELRTIADDFRSTYKKTNKGKEPIDLPELKASSLLSLLLPSPLLNRSVWTTVLFIVGWRILLRQR